MDWDEIYAYGRAVGANWLAIMAWVTFMTGDGANWFGARKFLDKILIPSRRRPIEILIMVAVVFWSGFQAWQEEKAQYDTAEMRRISSQEWLGKWKTRADDRWHAINDYGGYLDQIHRLQSQPPLPKKFPELKRMIAYQRPDIEIASLGPNSFGVSGFSLPTSNVGTDTLSMWIEQIVVIVDGQKIMEGKIGAKTIVPQSQSMPYDLKRIEGPFPISVDSKLVTVEFEVDYDTVPATGIRKSYRKVAYPLNWANGSNSSPQHEATMLDQWEK
jgi:hypothetical protein